MTLNIWGGHLHDQLTSFIYKHSYVDIFCLQEVYNNARQKLSSDDKIYNLNVFETVKNILDNHNAFFCPVINDWYGIAIFINKEIQVLDHGYFSIYENSNYIGHGPAHSRKLQWIKCCVDQHVYYVLNMHGLWNGLGKTDSQDRIIQSYKIKEFLDTIHGSKILCGDFNLLPDTRSISIINNSMKNLVNTYHIKSTRTILYPKDEKFADYIFVSPNVNVNHFEVLDDVVSDHAPLLIDCH